MVTARPSGPGTVPGSGKIGPASSSGGAAVLRKRRRQEIHRRRSDERGDIGVGWALEHVHGCGELGGATLMQQEQAVAERHRFNLVVRDVKARDMQALLEAADFATHLDAQLRIQVGQWLVEQEQLGFAHDGAAHGNALALSAR